MTYSFSVQRRECLLYTEEGVSLCYILRRQIPSLCRGESVPVSKELMEPPNMYSSGEFNDNDALYMTREGPLSIQRIECLQYTEERVSFLLLYPEERAPYRGESVFSTQRIECPSAIC